ncbi:MAG: ATP synthase F1 subunit gamma [Chloroflexi bacterium]|nr:ATP synthase F1 subunit gamma [Chloroflexota bacterium]
MATAREIKRRIGSVKNIAKVTGALEAVSASKVRRAQAQAEASRAYSRAAMQILQNIAENRDSEITHPLLEARETVRAVSIVLISSDRGLAGPYNANVVDAAIRFARRMEKDGREVQYITVGRKGRDMVVRRGATIVAEFTDLPAWPNILSISPITRAAIDDFLNGVVDEVYLAYTDFINTLQLEPVVRRLLPLDPTASEDYVTDVSAIGLNALYTFEPGAQAILDEIMPRFTELQLYQAVLESLASEHSARMIAMRNATENAESMGDDLTLSYNKARQSDITVEILDIVGGAEAVGE